MDHYQIGITGFFALLLLIALRVPIAFALSLIGLVGLLILMGVEATFSLISSNLYSNIALFTWVAVPLFLLMGYFAMHAGLTRAAFDATSLWLNRIPGGMAMASVAACTLFGACSGSGIAAAGALGRITIPEMLRHGYDKRLAAGAIASAATLAQLIPPSLGLIVYAILTQQSVGRLLLAGYIPGILSALLLMVMIYLRVKLNPSLAPRITQPITWRQRLAGLWGVWGIVVLILLVMGGIYSGFVAASEAAALGAAGAMIIALLSGKFNFEKFRDAIFETARTSGMLFLLLIGASIFTSFIAVSGLPDRLVEVIVNTQMSLYGLMIFIVILYLFLGCFLDAMSMMLLTLPVLLPILIKMEVNLIWFGIILCKLMEMGAITPPLGITVYVVKGVVGDKMTLEEIFRGIWWFLAIEFITLLILMVFPQISLFLPITMLGKG